MAEKCKDLSPMVSFDLIVEPSDQVKKDVADDALSVDVRSVTPTMKAITPLVKPDAEGRSDSEEGFCKRSRPRKRPCSGCCTEAGNAAGGLSAVYNGTHYYYH